MRAVAVTLPDIGRSWRADYADLPQHVLAKLLALDEGVEALNSRADGIQRDIPAARRGQAGE